MAVLKCKMCGGDLEIIEGSTICVCEYCGTKQTVPSLDNEKKVKLFERANRLRMACEFDKAFGVYESIVEEFPEEAEAYWGLFLCTYGIEYVDDPKTGKKVPTCHRSSFESVMDDESFEMVMENADAVARAVYREQAIEIEEIRKGIIEISSKEDPYDIFICYKESDGNGDRTIDSVIAQDIYSALVKEGYRVFFSRITLEDKLGREYEPYIFSALRSAKVMLAVGTCYDYFHAVWVKNEWSRFLKQMATDDTKALIPCFKDISPYDMPKEFARLQAQDMGKIGAIQDLVRGIGKIIPRGEPTVVVQQPVGAVSGLESMIAPLLTRANGFLKNGDFVKADEFFDKVLDFEPTRSEALIGKMLCAFKCKSLDDLRGGDTIISTSAAYKIAFESGNDDTKQILNELDKQILDNILARAKIKLAEKSFARASEYFKMVCDKFPSECYLGISLCKVGASKIEELSSGTTILDGEEYENALSFCDEETKNALVAANDKIKENILNDARESFDKGLYPKASQLFDVIKDDFEDEAYLKLFLCDIRVKDIDSIFIFYPSNIHFKNALEHCSEETKEALNSKFKSVEARLEKFRREKRKKKIIISSICAAVVFLSITLYLLFTQRLTYTRVGDGYVVTKCANNLKTEIVIPSEYKGKPVIGISDDAFKKCVSLTSVTIPDSVTSIGNSSFYGCSSLTRVTIGNSVTSIGSNAFDGCDSLTSVTIPDSVTSIGNSAFSGCSSLTSVTIPDSVTSIGGYAFCGCDSLTCVSIPNSVTSIDRGAFSGCSSLTSIVIPDSVTSIDRSAFEYCTSLTSIVIPDSVTSIGDGAFYGCDSLTIYCEAASQPSGWDSSWTNYGTDVIWGTKAAGETADGLVWRQNTTDNIIIYGYTGSGGSVTIPSTINNLPVTSIGNHAFNDCGSLTSVTIGNRVTSIGDDAFWGCDSLTSVTIPNSVTSIGWGAFTNCTSLTSVTIPNSVTSIDRSAFNGCSSLTSVTIGNSVTSIGKYAFYGCTSLTSVVIPDSVTSIGEYAFYGCYSLTSVVIPDSVTSIGYYAFYDRDSLTIYCEAASEPSGWNSDWNYSNCPVVWGYTGE